MRATLLVCLFWTLCAARTINDGSNDLLNEITGYEVVHPARVRPSGMTMFQSEEAHPEEIVFTLSAYGKDFHLNLRKNENLMADDYQEVEMSPQGDVLSVRSRQEVAHCYYQGDVSGDDTSFVALSTCDGLKGVLHGHGEHLHIHPAPSSTNSLNGAHIIFRQNQIKAAQSGSQSCGVKDDNTVSHYNVSAADIAPTSRRLLGTCAGSFKYVEEFIINDNARVNQYGSQTFADTLATVNIADGYYSNAQFTYCVKVVLAGQVAFTVGNPTTIRFRQCSTTDVTYPSCGAGCFSSASCDLWSNLATEVDVNLLLRDFTTWVSSNKATLKAVFSANNVDNSHLYTGTDFASSIVGLAWIGSMCSSNSVGVEQVTTRVQGYHAQVYAHEMGHNFGMQHDVNTATNIMSPSSNPNSIPTTFSSESVNYANTYFANTYGKSSYYPACLENVPAGYTNAALCGNGVLDAGEQCDNAFFPDSCCTNCRFAPGCVCANTQACCSNGAFKAANTVCRSSAQSSCDPVEYCTGLSGLCPPDLVAPLGTPCMDAGLPTNPVTPPQPSTCYAGQCVYSRTSQCRMPNNYATPTWTTCATTACNRLECSSVGGGATSFCGATWGLAVLDGTSCGGGSFCKAGACVPTSSFSMASSLALVTPAVGASWNSGTSNSITWSYTGSITTVKLYYQIGAVSTLIASVPASSRSYSWTVPAGLASSPNYKIRVEDSDSATTFAFSNTFTIGSSGIDYCGSNNGGCDSHTVCTNGPSSRVCSACPPGYTGSGTTSCVSIVASSTASSSSSSSSSSTSVAVPCGGCQNGGTCVGTVCSCPPFYFGLYCQSYVPPTLTTVSRLMYSSSSTALDRNYLITWTSTGGVPTVAIRLYAVSTQFAVAVISLTAPNSARGSYTWTVPNDLRLPSGSYFIKVSYSQIPISASSPTFYFDACAFNPCDNGGVCSNPTGVCTCTSAYSGPSCESLACNGCGPGVCQNGVCNCAGTNRVGAHCEAKVECNLSCQHGGTIDAACTSCNCEAAGFYRGPTCSTCSLACGHGAPDSSCSSCVCSAFYGGSACDMHLVCLSLRLKVGRSTITNVDQFVGTFSSDIGEALGIPANRVENVTLRADGDGTIVDFCVTAHNLTVAQAFSLEIEHQLNTPNSTLQLGDTTALADNTYGLGEPSAPAESSGLNLTTIASAAAILAVILVSTMILLFVSWRKQWCCFASKDATANQKARQSFQAASAEMQSSPTPAEPNRELKSDAAYDAFQTPTANSRSLNCVFPDPTQGSSSPPSSPSRNFPSPQRPLSPTVSPPSALPRVLLPRV